MLKTLNPEILNGWIGKSEGATDVIGCQAVRAMSALLDRPPENESKAPLPPLWHWLYFHTHTRHRDLGRDGHAKLGGFLPPVDLPRRMWAGGRLEFLSPLYVGDRVARTSTIKSISLKNGGGGRLCFVTVEHNLCRGKDLVLREEHDIVYREATIPGTPRRDTAAPPKARDMETTVTPDPVMLFRYSALTGNGHRIHYDREFCTSVEDYPGLVFHGPLTATLLADLAARLHASQERPAAERMTGFSFRATRPLFDTAPFEICGRAESGFTDLWATTPDGDLAMRAEAQFA